MSTATIERAYSYGDLSPANWSTAIGETLEEKIDEISPGIRPRKSVSNLVKSLHSAPIEGGEAVKVDHLIGEIKNNPDSNAVIALIEGNRYQASEQNEQGLSPLMLAAAKGRNDIVTALLKIDRVERHIDDSFSFKLRDQGTDPEPHNLTALTFASRMGHKDTAKILLNAGADIEPLLTELMAEIAGKARAKRVQSIIKIAPQVLELSNEEGLTPLMLAAAKGKVEVSQLLLKLGADPNKQVQTMNLMGELRAGFQGATALAFASQAGQFSTAKLLLEAQADPNIPASIANHQEPGYEDEFRSIYELFGNETIQVNDLSTQGRNMDTPLTLAKKAGDERLQGLLLQYGAL